MYKLLTALLTAGLLSLGLATPSAAADDVTTYETEASFDDALFDLREAIVNRGLVIDYESMLGAMLERTKKDVGSDVTLFEDARIFLFCSAKLSRAAMEADIASVARCPYGVFVYRQPGDAAKTIVGFRHVTPEGAAGDDPLRKIDALLDALAREAAGVE